MGIPTGMRALGRRIFDFYWGQGIADDVPALTYYLVLSLAPVALGIAALEALLLHDVQAALHVADQLNRFLPEGIHHDIERLVVRTRDNSPMLLALAIATMLWTTSGAIGVIERCESRILDCARHNVLTGRLRNIMLGLGVSLMVALAGASAPVIGDAADALDLRGALGSVTLAALTALGSIVAFTVIYRYAPRTRPRWRSAVVGAVPAGVAMQAVPSLVGLYVGATAGFAAVRLFLLLAVVLFGLYAIALVMLVGAGMCAQRELRHRGPERRRRLPGVPAAFGREAAGPSAPGRIVSRPEDAEEVSP